MLFKSLSEDEWQESLTEEKHKKLFRIETRWLLAGWKSGICLRNKTNLYVIQGKKLIQLENQITETVIYT